MTVETESIHNKSIIIVVDPEGEAWVGEVATVSESDVRPIIGIALQPRLLRKPNPTPCMSE